jgi:GntR family transcriptional regulator
MISFDSFIAQDGVPIYLQIVKHIKSGIVSGTVINGDEVPSRRVLSALLGVNPNTIQKAYKMLEDEGLMESRSGAKSYMCFDEKIVGEVRQQLLENDATAFINSLKQMGLNKQEALALIENYWE